MTLTSDLVILDVNDITLVHPVVTVSLYLKYKHGGDRYAIDKADL